jgi:DNA-binding response OmpR family regulator
MNDNQTLTAVEPAQTPLRFESNPPDHILVVEDDSSIRRLNAQVLARSGYAVDVAVDGADAWGALGTDNYDLMITDNNMPKLTGVELLMKLHAARMNLPVIMATGKFPAEQFTSHPWLQPAAVLLKPYTIEDLLRTVKKVLRETDTTTAGYQQFTTRAVKANRDAPAITPNGSAASGTTDDPQRILVVDEDRDLRQLYTEALAVPGYEIDVAADGASGWEALQAKPYHLLITEHDLPKVTGIELVRKLRAAHMAVPVVMAAGRMPTAELARNPSLRLAATLAKPFSLDALRDTVKKILCATFSPRKPAALSPNG